MATSLFQQLPWDGGLHVALDESMIAPNELTVAENITISSRGPRRKRDGISHNWDDAVAGTDKVLAIHDLWHGTSSRTQKRISVDSTGAVHSFNSAGARTTLTVGGTAWSGTLTSACTLSFNNRVLIAVDGATNVLKMWSGSGDVEDVPGTPPKASAIWEHQGRIFTNDKDNKDDIRYSPTADHTQWMGLGDSGGFPVGRGDGDTQGITAGISWRGDNWVFKRGKIYRIVGSYPEEYQIVKVSDTLGCVGPNALTVVDNGDLYFVSEKGIHSMSEVLNNGAFTSAAIQRYFEDDLSRVRMSYAQACYLSHINAVAFAVTEESSSNRTNTTNEVNNTLIFYSLTKGQWYKWPDVSCQSLGVITDADAKRLYIGTHTGKISKAFNGLTYDLSAAGAQVAIRRRVSSGVIFVDQSPFTLKSFKRFVLYYKPRGRQTTAITFKIDDAAQAPENMLSFSNAASASALGLGFSLGATPLGSAGYFKAYVQPLNGIGRGCKITIEESSLTAQSDIEGFAIEFEAAGYFYEAV